MDLKERVKKLGFRVTKDVKGKRVKLTNKELRAKIDRKKKKSQPTLENQARDAKKFIRVCKMVLREAESNTPRAPKRSRTAAPPPPPGVPIDGGLSILVVAAVGYGAHKMKKEEI